MNEHVHEYQWKSIHRKYLCIHCPKALNVYEAMPLLNATERLGLEWARQFVEDCDEAMETTSGVTMEIYRSDIELLRAYADILEDKP